MKTNGIGGFPSSRPDMTGTSVSLASGLLNRSAIIVFSVQAIIFSSVMNRIHLSHHEIDSPVSYIIQHNLRTDHWPYNIK